MQTAHGEKNTLILVPASARKRNIYISFKIPKNPIFTSKIQWNGAGSEDHFGEQSCS